MGAAVGVTGATLASAAVASPGLASPDREGSDPRATADTILERPENGAAHGLTPADDAVRALFGPLREGSAVGAARIEAIYAARAGAIPVVMSAGGARFAVEVFRAAPDEPAPLGRAGALSLYLVNRGDGGRATPEAFGLGVQALAAALEPRVASGAPIPSALVTIAERRRAHPAGVFPVPLHA